MRRLATIAAATLVTLSLAGCSVTDDRSTATPPASAKPTPRSSASAAATELSKPLGSWELGPGIPANTPTDLPLPKDRWIPEFSTPFDDEGGMTELWVTSVEFEQVLLDFKDVGWEFERSESSGRTNIVAYQVGQPQAVAITYTPESPRRDARLTVTYVASRP